MLHIDNIFMFPAPETKKLFKFKIEIIVKMIRIEVYGIRVSG